MAQSFVVPTDNVLDYYQFAFDRGGVSVNFDIYLWDQTSGPVGGTLYSTSFITTAGDNLVSGINLTLTTGSMYAAIVDMGNDIGTSVHWMQNNTGNPLGDVSWYNGVWQYLNSGWSTRFKANFTGANAYRLTVNMPNGCPGSITVSWSGAGTGQQGLVIGNQLGTFTIPQNQPCGGTVLGITGQVMLVSPPGIFSTGGGSGSINGQVNANGVCGRYLQLVKGGSCNTSNTAQIQ